MSELPNGLHAIPRDEYDRIGRVNWSTLKHLGRSPAHYRHKLLLRGAGDTDAMKLGRAVHLAVFEPERFAREAVVYHDRRVGKFWDAFEKEHAGREILTDKMMAEAMALQTAARANPLALKYLGGGRGEVSLLWTHESKAVASLPGWKMPCKGRVDFISKAGAIVDLKTTKDASPDGFGREAARLEYHVQAAWYVDAHRAAAGQELPFVIFAVEKVAPYVCQVYRVPEELLELGRERYRALLDHLHVCLEESHWPAYSNHEELDLQLPRWAAPAEEEDIAALDLVIQ